MNSMFSGIQGVNPFVPSFSNPFSNPFFGGMAGQIGNPMMTNTFNPFTPSFGIPASPFGTHFGQPINSFGTPFGFSPVSSQAFQGFSPFGWNVPSLSPLGTTNWNQGLFNPMASGFATPFSSPFAGSFNTPFTSPFGSFQSGLSGSFSSPFGVPFSGPLSTIPGFDGPTQGDWSILGGRLGSLPISGGFNQPIWNGFSGLPTGIQSTFPQNFFPGSISPTFGFGSISGFSPISSIWNTIPTQTFGQNFVQPFGQNWGVPFGSLPTWNAQGSFPTFGGFSSPLTQTIASPMVSPITGNFPGSGVSQGTGFAAQSVHGTPSTHTSSVHGVNTPNTGTLNQSAGATFFAPTGINGLPVQLVAGQFPGQFPVQGWNPGVQTNNFGGLPLNTVQGPIYTNGYGQPVYQPGFQFTGFHSPLTHGHGEVRNGTGTTINVSQRDAA